MRRPSFFEGVGVALVLSVLGGAVYFLIAPSVKGLVVGLSFLYLVYLLRRSPARVGKMTTLLLWFGATGVAFFILSPPLFIVLQALMLGLVRALYFYSSALSAVFDLTLNGVAFVAAWTALMHTGSVFLSIWSFFLLQALFVMVPQNFKKNAQAAGLSTHPALNHTLNDSGNYSGANFQRAHRNADTALRALVSQSKQSSEVSS